MHDTLLFYSILSLFFPYSTFILFLLFPVILLILIYCYSLLFYYPSKFYSSVLYVQVYVLKRPHVDEFLQAVGQLFECVLFTASLGKVCLKLILLADWICLYHPCEVMTILLIFWFFLWFFIVFLLN